jgi:hypothetical protein
LAACATVLVVTPVATVTAHCSYAFSVAVAAVNVNVAVAVPELASDVVNVVVPHPFIVGVAKLLSANVGSTSAMLSLAASGTFNANVYERDDVAVVTGLSMLNTLCFNAGVGATTAVDVVIAVAATLSAVANVTATVRVARFAACAAALVVTPVAIVTAHSTSVARVAVAAVSVTFAVAVPEFAAATVNVVVPHPLVTGVANEISVKSGNTNATLSLAFSGAFNLNLYVIDDDAHVTGFAIVSTLFVGAGATTAVDMLIGVATTFADAANATAMVRVFKSATCVTALVVTPLATVTEHCVRVGNVAVAAVNVKVAVAVPEFAEAIVNVVDEQPSVVGDARDAKVKCGNSMTNLSLVATAALTANTNVNDVGADVTGFVMVKALCTSSGVNSCDTVTDFVPDAAAKAPDCELVVLVAAVSPSMQGSLLLRDASTTDSHLSLARSPTYFTTMFTDCGSTFVAGLMFELGQERTGKLVLAFSYSTVVTFDNCNLMPESTQGAQVLTTISPWYETAAADSV